MPKVILYNSVKSFIEQNKCKLLTEECEYKNAQTILKIECACGKIFNKSFSIFKNGKQMQCPDCGIIKAHDSCKLTYEYVKKNIETESDCKLLSKEYNNITTKLKLLCNCGENFYITFNKFQQGKHQCKKCGLKNRSKQAKIPYNNIKIFVEKYGCLLLTLEKDYIDTQNKIDIICACGEIYRIDYNTFKSQNQRNCKKCSIKKQIKKQTIPFDIVKEYINGVNGNGCVLLTPKEEYINSCSKLNIVCVCGKEFNKTFRTFKNTTQKQCKECGANITSKKLSMTHEEYIDIVGKLVGEEYSVLENYKNSTNKILMIHNKCGHKWLASPQGFIRNGRRCPVCSHKESGKKRRKSQEEFEAQTKEIWGEDYVVIGKYITMQTKVEIKHNKCNRTWNITPSHFLYSKAGCPYCQQSKGENRIYKFLEMYNINYKKEFKFKDCKDKMCLRFDFAIFEKDNLQMLIEYDGQQHYKEFSKFGNKSFLKTQKHDLIKNDYCKANNIKLLRIPYWDFDNIESILEEELSKKNKSTRVVATNKDSVSNI